MPNTHHEEDISPLKGLGIHEKVVKLNFLKNL